MIVYPNAKINIGLSVIGKREDGFHNLETVLYPLPGLRDILEMVVRAYKLLAAPFDLPGVNISLHKVIPYAAGLGGGSSDAAFTLNALNEYFELKIPERNLLNYAARLGSDCAFFIRNRPAFAGGKGELLEDIDLVLERTVPYPQKRLTPGLRRVRRCTICTI